MVTAGSDVDVVLFSDDGCAESLTSGSIVIDMSTIGVEWAVSIDERLRER
jgi:3-hydroxyisobutyrate dehydrogenase-like beta-hydroxyacid dehydrogenase